MSLHTCDLIQLKLTVGICGCEIHEIYIMAFTVELFMALGVYDREIDT